ncbi:MAG: DUF4105 domain-containing protein [Cytophagales bacterium]|nr:DUF4105 domain-containing protein [Cytophagales bacterium]
MRKAIIALFFVLSGAIFSEAQVITPSTRISLLTGSPGTELYNTFGHSAIRVRDLAQGFDTVFNYGTFNPYAQDFYIQFARRKVDYWLGIESFNQFERSFYFENRSVTEHELNLSYEQKQRLYDMLVENHKPEHRYYRYDFFFDNCATRIRDIMISAFGDEFQYNYPSEWQNGKLTFRNLIDLYLTNHHWSDFGIDLALGLPTDAIASPADYMFLPDYLMKGFESATIMRDGKQVPFTGNGRLIIPRKDIEPGVFRITPVKLTWTLFIISVIISYFSQAKGVNMHWFDVFYFCVIGLIGWVVFFLWFFTDHIATKNNLNLLWAVPIYFPVFFFWNKLPKKYRFWNLVVFGGINTVILLFWAVFPQNYHPAFIPLILTILLRFFFLFQAIKRK